MQDCTGAGPAHYTPPPHTSDCFVYKQTTCSHAGPQGATRGPQLANTAMRRWQPSVSEREHDGGPTDTEAAHAHIVTMLELGQHP